MPLAPPAPIQFHFTSLHDVTMSDIFAAAVPLLKDAHAAESSLRAGNVLHAEQEPTLCQADDSKHVRSTGRYKQAVH